MRVKQQRGPGVPHNTVNGWTAIDQNTLACQQRELAYERPTIRMHNLHINEWSIVLPAKCLVIVG